MTEYHNKNVIVVGAGRSGIGLARYFAARGAVVTLSDRRSREQLPDLAPLAGEGVGFDLGGHNEALFSRADLIALSPGVPPEVPAIAAAAARGVPVLGEIEIAWRELPQPLVAITGTNGKSTVTTVMGDAFRAWGRQTFVGGNLGTPLIEAVGTPWDWLVVELSSFQLETIERFRPRWAVLLNITEDHLDRYPDMAGYQAAKARLFENQTAADRAVLNADDPRVLAAAAGTPARRILFSSSRELAEGMSLAGSELVWRWAGREERFAADELRIRGQHNLENVMAALIPPLVEGCPPAVAWAAACAFAGLPHRMELVADINGVRWYDDSKGTNVGSVVKSLAGLEAPVTLIAGGKDKHGDLSPLAAPIAAKVANLVLIGEAAPRMAEAFNGLTAIHRAGSMAEAVAAAAALTPAGGTVLLSPGCSSFDMFKSFEERGRIFAAAVRALPGAGEGNHGS
ncbi:MAG: UDP-N-acetylmuramoyl-L-alanine--D-glutamate ligase [Deltaproteobacteria bacterium]|nr:MAG: UDP-N-acetylmuramoyl-L-alanine--D-glutamate ligase [Deltaproteobacteria bacterium]